MVLRTSMLAVVAVTLTGSAAVGQEAGRSADRRAFQTPQAAAEALMEACKKNDTKALIGIFGDVYRTHTDRINDAEEAAHRREFYERASQFVKYEKQGDDRVLLVVGRDLWPFPAPLVKDKAGWRFDAAAGMKEMLARRIGENESDAIEVCREYVKAQVEYASEDRDGDEVREYAQRIASTPGKRDGLYWKVDVEGGEPLSPLGPFLAKAGAGEDRKPGEPFMGYYFKIITKQGGHPPGGKYDYVINGNMIAGFALVAWPADYGESGVMTFVVSHQGKVFESDLGKETPTRAAAMSEYDPDESCTLVE